jgi:hypothetical protein
MAPLPNDRSVFPGWVASVLLLIVAIAAMGPASSARADYSVNRHFYTPIGTGGTLVWNQSTALDTSDMVSAWNFWTGTGYLSTTSDISTCGSSKSCVYVMNENATIASCTMPDIPGTGTWALTYLEAYPDVNNVPCDYGTPTYPIYIVVLNSSMSFNATQLQHIRRHEMGHVLQLGHPASAVSCWFDVVVYPLMKENSTNCASYPQNATPSPNEAYYAELWSY